MHYILRYFFTFSELRDSRDNAKDSKLRVTLCLKMLSFLQSQEFQQCWNAVRIHSLYRTIGRGEGGMMMLE